jgi:hypothetical protein
MKQQGNGGANMAGPDRDRDYGRDPELDRGRPEDWSGYGFGHSRDYNLPYERTTDYGYVGNPSYGAEIPDYSWQPSRYRWRDDYGPYFGGYAGRPAIPGAGAGADTGAGAGGGSRADYRGRGPRGYKRSDDRILEDVSERLTDSPDVDASDFEINVSNGEVTLSGSAGSRHEKRMAGFIAEEVRGVIHVNNQLELRPRHHQGP